MTPLPVPPASPAPDPIARHRTLLRVLLGVAAAIAGLLTGYPAGELFAYSLAAWTDRDIAELKDMLIWCLLTGPLVMASLGVLLAAWATGARRMARIVAGGLFGLVFAGSAALILAAYDWPKAAGYPVIDYELRLPAGVALPDGVGPIDLTVWNEKAGSGCYIGRLRRDLARHEMAGTIVLGTDNRDPIMSLRLERGPIRYWRLPYRPDSTLEKEWRPWETVAFIAAPRGETVPPEGAYEIRYRLRRYM